MSTVDIDAKIRELRRRIIRAIATLPNYMLRNVAPMTIGANEFLNKPMINVPLLQYDIAVVDINNNEIVPEAPSMFEEVSIDENAMLANIVEQYIDRGMPCRVRVTTSDGIQFSYTVTLSYQRFRHGSYSVYREDVEHLWHPPGYAPGDPIDVRCLGHLFAGIADVIEVHVWLGRVGYYTESGAFISWYGTLMRIGRLGTVGGTAEVITPVASLHVDDTEYTSPIYVSGTLVSLLAKKSISFVVIEV